ncbi:hypothetical protein VB735_10415 [Halotia wernerae UHCC 0503]|nr:hypothetical protein [Halotia wernerae UHCC 0503]
MSYQSKDEYLHEMPLILAGPILQYTEPESVTVWLALQQACYVELKIYDTTNNATVLGNSLLQGNCCIFWQ